MDEKSAWEQFMHTGSVVSYLVYCKAKQQALGSTRSTEEETDADQHRWTGNRGEERGRE